jgi:hypothetical protein
MINLQTQEPGNYVDYENKAEMGHEFYSLLNQELILLRRLSMQVPISRNGSMIFFFIRKKSKPRL